ncbi:hypothetical protein AB0M48_05510 [Lentzea sp. NPDC051208]|uniref:hypothetical protein n=1 Tax=Lentzea sp. NPDC051208 TaxID=3154642 RepID=UPI0034409231
MIASGCLLTASFVVSGSLDRIRKLEDLDGLPGFSSIPTPVSRPVPTDVPPALPFSTHWPSKPPKPFITAPSLPPLPRR